MDEGDSTADKAPPQRHISNGQTPWSFTMERGPGAPHTSIHQFSTHQTIVQATRMLQQALGRAGGVAWSSLCRNKSSPPRIRLPPTTAPTNRGYLGPNTTPTTTATTSKPLRHWLNTDSSSSSWVPIRAASQEAFSEMALEKKKCIPCETGKLQAMSEEKAHSLLPEVVGWELKEIDGVLQLHRSWKAKSFVKGLEIMKRVADVAEAEGHHPDLHLVNWNQLSINISTHAVGGLTENDFIVAAKIGALDLTDLVRKPKAAAK